MFLYNLKDDVHETTDLSDTGEIPQKGRTFLSPLSGSFLLFFFPLRLLVKVKWQSSFVRLVVRFVTSLPLLGLNCEGALFAS